MSCVSGALSSSEKLSSLSFLNVVAMSSETDNKHVIKDKGNANIEKNRD